VIRDLTLAVRVAAIVASVLLPLTQADAHGGKLQRGLAPAGPYLVSVWTQPDPARVGALDLSAAILRPDTRELVPDAAMRMIARHSTSSQSVEAAGSRAAGGLFDLLVPPLYHASAEIPAPGRWHVTVSVGGLAGRGDVDFDLEIGPPLTIPWGLIAASASVSSLALAGWCVVRRSARRRQAGVSAPPEIKPSRP
jgi:hypothetical protein